MTNVEIQMTKWFEDYLVRRDAPYEVEEDCWLLARVPMIATVVGDGAVDGLDFQVGLIDGDDPAVLGVGEEQGATGGNDELVAGGPERFFPGVCCSARRRGDSRPPEVLLLTRIALMESMGISYERPEKILRELVELGR